MSRRLILIRHAKSTWTNPALDDHARSLNRRGERAAKAIGHWLARHAPVCDLVLCSPAARARETWAEIAAALAAAS